MPSCPSMPGSVTISTFSEITVPCGVTISSFSVSAIGLTPVSCLGDFLDAALHIEVSFRNAVVLAVENLLEPADGIGDRNLSALAAGEDLGGAERLAEEALNLSGSEHRQLVFR